MRSSSNQAVEARSQSVRALLCLREMILSGELPAGQRISEPVVAELTGISRTPIRSALIRLEEEGLIESIPTGGFRARAFSIAEIRDSIECRGLVEGLSARIAAERGADPGALEIMRDSVTEIDEILAQGELNQARFSAYIEANARFHEALAAVSKSEVVERQITRANALPFASPNGFVQLQELSYAGKILLIANAQHAAVLEAIEHREGARAEALVREHARIAHRSIDHALDNPNTIKQVPGGCLIQSE